MKRPLLLFLGVIFAFNLNGCLWGPDYNRPEIETPKVWRLDLPQAAALANAAWWESFQDPQLTELIRTALRENQDLLRATAAVEKFFALYGVSRSALFPQTAAEGQYSREESSASTKPAGLNDPVSFFSADFGLAWELDFWGRIRRSNEAAWADLLSQAAFRRALILSLVSSVATVYVDLRSLDVQLAISRETVKSRQAGLKVIKTRFEGGYVSELDVRQAEADLLQAQIAIPQTEQQIAQSENLLSILIGRNPGPIQRGLPLTQLLQATAVPSGLPADLLQQRPDVAAAEEQLRAANARIGAAVAQYFPNIRLTGAYGFASAELSNWIEHPAQFWAFGPSLNLPIFTAGRISNEVEFAEAATREALHNYRQAVLTALREVNDALVGYQNTGSEEQLRVKQVQVLRRYLDLANKRYEEGQTPYLEVLDAERSLYSSQLDLARTQSARLGQMIELYRAMGGGWVAEADKLTDGWERESIPLTAK